MGVDLQVKGRNEEGEGRCRDDVLDTLSLTCRNEKERVVDVFHNCVHRGQ